MVEVGPRAAAGDDDGDQHRERLPETLFPASMFDLPDLDQLFPDTASGSAAVAAVASGRQEEERELALRVELLEREAQVEALEAQVERQRAFIQELQASLSTLSLELAGDAESSRPRGGRLPMAAPSPLVEAARRGDALVVALMLDAAASSGAPADPGALSAALVAAAEHGHVGVVEMLIARGADVHSDHDSALLWACHLGDRALPLLRLLLAKGGDPNALRGCPLRIAARMGAGHLGTVEALVRGGARLDERDDSSSTAAPGRSLDV